MTKETATQKKRRLEKKRLYRHENASKGKSYKLMKFANESQEQREVRQTKDRQRKSVARANETNEEHISRIALVRSQITIARVNETPENFKARRTANKEHMAQTRATESAESSEARRTAIREYMTRSRATESAENCEARRATNKEHMAQTRATESVESSEARHAANRVHMAQSRLNESAKQREERHAANRDHMAQSRANESAESFQARHAANREYMAQSRANETATQREERLQGLREEYALRMANGAEFTKAINTHCDRTCEVCKKTCYPNQVTRYINSVQKPYLPPELASKVCLELCHRCNAHMRDQRKSAAPSKAYWNNLDPGKIPDEIAALTKAERELLLRIRPYIKVIKFPNQFGQYGCKGQAILFAYDLFEVSEKLPQMLPRGTHDTGLVVVTETFENINISKEYSISRDRVYAALRWLIRNNPLYQDVTINHFALIDESDIVRVVPPEPLETRQPNNEQMLEQQQTSAYITLDANKNVSRIVRASWHQANQAIFGYDTAGTQCLAMSMANIVRAAILPPSRWNTNVLNANMLEANDLYREILEFSMIASTNAHPIPQNGHLELLNLDVIGDDFMMYNRSISLRYDDSWLCTGSLRDQENDGESLLQLRDGIARLFEEHNAGILISSGYTFALIYRDGKYYFTDSHSCGPKGAPANENGRACVIECDSIDELVRILRRTVHSASGIQYSIHYIDVLVAEEDEEEQAQAEIVAPHNEMNATPIDANDIEMEEIQEFIPVHTSVMAPIDIGAPDVEDAIVESRNLNEITRKTANNIVNTTHEKKAEEFAWYYLFPEGKNGLNEEREVRITPLDYYQSRILNREPRIQSNDHLFYALSMFEASRVATTIAVSGKKIRNEHGKVENVHLHMQNLRGSAAYWRTAHCELIAMIRCLGPPTWFITFSCNDINWLDMRKELLIADNRPHVDPSSISRGETQRLIEKYPVVVSRHFMQRVSAIMKFLKKNQTVLGGKIKDFWWRIEFQKRGSPHLHMVIWIENAPSFENEEGMAFVDRVVTCHYPSEADDPDLHALVKRNQIHHHTHTCFKNNDTRVCRFAFPRQVCQQTRIISQTSDEFIRSGGRICLLKRRNSEKMVNNYCQAILELWDANMDIQPCGSNEGIAHYIAKYISKSEPTEVTPSVAQAVRQIMRQTDTDLSRKLFKACMRILKEREISACECAFRLCHLQLRDGSRKCVFLNTRKPEQRYHVLRFEGNQATGMCANMFERYEKRPMQHADYDFKNMTLRKFAMLFEAHYAKKDTAEVSVDADANLDEEIEAQPLNRLLKLTDNSKMRIRNIPAVIRVPHFVMQNDPENFFYSLLLQYKPYEKETELLEGFANARDAFLACEAELRARDPEMAEMRERDIVLENAFRQAHAFTILEQPEDYGEEEYEEEIEAPAMTDEQFQSACAAMNVKQRELYNMVTQSIQAQINGSTRRDRFFVTGGAGVGKTFTFNTLKNQVNRCYGRVAVKVCALTGVAAQLVGGSTIHSLLKLPVQKDGNVTANMPLLTGNYLKLMRLQWKEIEYIFIDEISMVPYEMLCMIDSRLRQLKRNDNLPFGGINIIVFGDLMQLPPVRGAQVFEQPARFLPATHLWRLFTLVELTENMRQRGDTTFADLLNALREGKMEADQFNLLLSKQLVDETGNFAIDKAIRIFPTNDQVRDHNDRVFEQYKANGARIYDIKAQDRIVDSTRNMDNIPIDSVISTDINKTGGLAKNLKIFVGEKVMLRSNINVERGLVNGSIGTITEIVWPYFRRDMVDPNDIPSVRINFERIGTHLIEPKAIQFPALRSFGTAERRMLPLIPCWACTVHKMQGCTVDHAVIYLGKKVFKEGMAYVALSRARSLEGVRIIDLDCTILTGKKPCNEKALEEMERMRNYRPPEDPAP